MMSKGPTPPGGRHGRVRLHGEQTAAHAEPVRVLARQAQRAVRQVDCEHARVLDLVRRRDADAAGAAAQVEDTRGNARLRLLDGQLTQLFRVRARDEHGLVHAEGQSVKVPFAEDVGERLAAEHTVAQDVRVVHRRVVQIGMRPGGGMGAVGMTRHGRQLARGHRRLRVAAVAQPMKQLKIYVIDRLCHRSTPENQFFFPQEQEPMTFTAL